MTQAEFVPQVANPVQSTPRYEMADVIRAFGPEYLDRHPLPHSKLKVLRAIVNCRTAALGGKVYGCKDCGHEHFAFNSCRNRHCPKCQHEAREEWLEKQIKDLLPVPYFHVVFTLPHELNELVLANQRQLYGLLFQSAVRTMLQFGQNNLKAQLGILAVLHTWGQELTLHPHIHMLVTGGGLSLDQSRWVAMREDYLFPVTALSQVYQARFLSGLKRLFNAKRLRFPESLRDRSSLDEFEYWLRKLASTKWNVYTKAPFGGARQVLSYLGRYTHRVAISNNRITGIELEEKKVSFTFKNYRKGDAIETRRLDAHEFIHRFLLHVLPSGFKKIRAFGLLGNALRKKRLARCRELLSEKVKAVAAELKSALEQKVEKLLKAFQCPQCESDALEFRRALVPLLPAQPLVILKPPNCT